MLRCLFDISYASPTSVVIMPRERPLAHLGPLHVATDLFNCFTPTVPLRLPSIHLLNQLSRNRNALVLCHRVQHFN